jgi:putative ABC transport system ATP-binding protein
VPDLAASNVSLSFGKGAGRVAALRDISVAFVPGRLHVVAGPSGSGKTSLLSILGAMISPDAGRLTFCDTDLLRLSPDQRNTFRRSSIGYVFQAFRLMRALSAADNVLLSLEVRCTEGPGQRCLESLKIVGLQGKAHLTPDQMSGGEQQRVAIARAIAHRPSIVLADEPTANLDSANGHVIMTLLREIAHDPSRIVIIVSHDPRVFSLADRLIRIEDGCLVGDEICSAAL